MTAAEVTRGGRAGRRCRCALGAVSFSSVTAPARPPRAAMSAPGSGGEFGNPLRKFKLVFLGEQSGEMGGGGGGGGSAGGAPGARQRWEGARRGPVTGLALSGGGEQPFGAARKRSGPFRTVKGPERVLRAGRVGERKRRRLPGSRAGGVCGDPLRPVRALRCRRSRSGPLPAPREGGVEPSGSPREASPGEGRPRRAPALGLGLGERPGPHCHPAALPARRAWLLAVRGRALSRCRALSRWRPAVRCREARGSAEPCGPCWWPLRGCWALRSVALTAATPSLWRVLERGTMLLV